MKKYNITVNGTAYEVEVEEVGGVSTPVTAAPAAPAPAAAPAAPAPAAPKAAPAPSAGANSVSAPMPGTVLEVKVTPGQAVNAGDVLVILEAMKMENEITAPKSGTIVQIAADKGKQVNTGDLLFVIS